MSDDEALKWRSLGVDPSAVDEFFDLPWDEVKSWTQLGIDIDDAGWLTKIRIPIRSGRALLKVGCPPKVVTQLLETGVTPRRFHEYVAQGVDPKFVARLAARGIGPEDGVDFLASDVDRAWQLDNAAVDREFWWRLRDANFSQQDIAALARKQVTSEQCLEWVNNGIPPSVIARCILSDLSLEDTLRQWHKGLRSPSAIESAVLQERRS